jgi:hypothetical protein
MGGEQARRVGLFVLGGPGAGILFEKDEDGEERLPVRIVGGHDAARRWAEAHYERLEWESPHRATALVGRLATRPPPSPRIADRSGWDQRRLTYESEDLRAYLPELLAGQRGPVILQQCEEYVRESGRWEPFTTILWESTW